jgi:hypothetical protein
VFKRTLDEAVSIYRRDAGAAMKLVSVGESSVDGQVALPELAAWTVVSSQVMNLDESLTK